MADIVTMTKDELKARGKADAAALAARAVSNEADGTELMASQDTIPTWRQRDYSSVPIGTPYKWNGIVYKLWQQHDATDPAKATPYAEPQGTRGTYQTDECCTEDGHVWKCTQANTVYPPSQLPGSWTDLGTVEEVQGQ